MQNDLQVKTLILDDDPTGTQSASGVVVLLRWDSDSIAKAFRKADAVYILTNTRAVDEATAVALVTSIVADARRAGEKLGETIRFILRGDSTLRGHVFAESEAVGGAAPILFVPAYPDGGRTTIDGHHMVRVNGKSMPVEQTEFAEDPVFGYRHGRLDEYVLEKSNRIPRLLDIDVVRDTDALRTALCSAVDGDVLLPDVHDDSDIGRLAAAVRDVWLERNLVVRSAAPLAAAIAQVMSTDFLKLPIEHPNDPVLLVCGSHTSAASRQLDLIATMHGLAIEIETERALIDATAEGHRVADLARKSLIGNGLAVLASERVRRPEHDTLEHGEQVMRALVTAVADLRELTSIVVSKGGITGADVACEGIGANRAEVRGQIMAGVSVWDLQTQEGRKAVQVVVPGNIGDDDALVVALAAVGC